MSCSISSRETVPGRNRTGRSPASESTVDSMPTRVGPPSRIRSTASPKPRRTCSAVVGESRVNRLALGAAMGTPAARISASASGCEGMRRPTVGSPAVAISGTAPDFGTTSVSGPGQCRRASAPAASGHSRASERAMPIESTCTIIGLVAGRPLAAKILATAPASSALAPSPYTVSVGKATNFPARISSAACFSLSDASLGITPGDRPCRRRRSCPSCATPGRRGSVGRGRRPARGRRRRWRAWSGDP